ncbi:MAG: XdhC family protein [Armatimonadetes bacterium]|nr:XdhC family protein [Armatimonadota bacterium]
MRDVAPVVKRWLDEGHRFALATVVETWGSAPRPVGSVMAVRDDGLAFGSVSAGCIESHVAAQALEHMGDASATRLDFRSVSDEEALEVGLSCGGSITVLLEPSASVDPFQWEQIDRFVRDGVTFVRGSNVTTGEARLWPSCDLNQSFDDAAMAITDRGAGALIELEGDPWFFNLVRKPSRLIVIGAVHTTQVLVRFAHELGFHVTVIDPRATFADPQRFTDPPDALIASWPQDAMEGLELDRDSYAVLLSHDSKIDDPALRLLLSSNVAYIGALGGRQTQQKRRDRMAAEGFSEGQIARIRGPIGLDIGSKTPAEIALSIMAEVVQVMRGKS